VALAVAAGLLLVATLRLLMLDARTGALLRALPGGIPGGWLAVGIGASLGIDGGANRVVAADWAGQTIDILSATSGALLGRVGLGGHPLQIVVDARRHRALAALDTNDVVVLDTRGGGLRRLLHLAQPGGPLMLDPQSGHVLVATSGLVPARADPWAWMPSWLRAHLPFIPPPLGPAQRLLRSTLLTLDPAR
jgi:hypothetical protein